LRAPQPLGEALLDTREEAHCDSVGTTSFGITTPLGPRDGRARPFSSSFTPPALPTVSVNGPDDVHSRTWPAGIVSSTVCPSAARTRIHVGSTVRATRRYPGPPPVFGATAGGGGADIAGGADGIGMVGATGAGAGIARGGATG